MDHGIWFNTPLISHSLHSVVSVLSRHVIVIVAQPGLVRGTFGRKRKIPHRTTQIRGVEMYVRSVLLTIYATLLTRTMGQ